MLLSAVILMIFSRHFSGFSQDIEPSEPSIVLPAVVLEIEDLSIESITAVLPEDEEILPPEIEFPLPEVGELEVEEPHMDFTMPQRGEIPYNRGCSGNRYDQSILQPNITVLPG